MDKANSPYFKGAIWLGLVVLIPISGLLYSALTSEASAPRWVGILFLMIFFNAGLTIVFLDSLFNAIRDTLWFAYLQAFVLLSIPFMFAILLNWVAFGPGVREFSGGISVPFISFSSGQTNSLVGRIIFAIPALLMDVFIGVAIVAVIKNALGEGQNT
jgi:hypothetical protein